MRDLKAKLGFKPLVEKRALVVSSEGIEHTKSNLMGIAAKAIGVREGVIRCARNNGRDFVKRFEDESMEVLLIKWC